MANHDCYEPSYCFFDDGELSEDELDSLTPLFGDDEMLEYDDWDEEL